MKQLVLTAGSVQGDRVRLGGPDFHYLAHVRRLEPGDRVPALFDTRRLVLEVVRIQNDQMELLVKEAEEAGKRPTEVTLFPFLLKSGKLDDVIRQACEAGVAQIVPVQGDHCVSRLESKADGEKKLSRWKSIARQAAQQSGNTAVCEVFPPLAAADLLTWWDARGPLLVFHQLPLAKAGLHRYLADKPAQVGLVIGPEGGLSDAEIAAFLAGGGLPVWLGPAVLRAETASLHAAAAVNIILQERSEWTISPLPASNE